MITIGNKYLLVALIGVALGLMVLWPILGLYAVSSFALWEIALIYLCFFLPSLLGLLLLVRLWGTFEMKQPKQ